MAQAGTGHRPVFRDGASRAGRNGIAGCRDDASTDDPDDLFARVGLPDALGYLARECPRDAWVADDIDETAKDWLFKHDWFRLTQRALLEVGAQWRSGEGRAHDYHRLVLPMLQRFLPSLDYHQSTETDHYFPAMARMEPGMEHGFDLLDRDHARIHVLLIDIADAASALQDRIAAGGEGRAEAARVTIAIENAAVPVARHLWDEEEIVIPLLILRGDPLSSVPLST